jgi:hypothetical protein
MLAGAGFAQQLREISDFIEDIEYERAVEKVKALLDSVRQKVGAEHGTQR